jgi:hypothetical protein
MTLVNIETGQQATQAEYADCVLRAREIIQSPYSSPEQIEWALQFPGMEYVFWESANDRRLARQRQESQR